jgi:hypothetical protein
LALNVKLKPVSSVEVDTFPSGATVYLDGKMVGQSPIVINDVYSGNHFIKVEKEGYLDQKKSILIGSGENRKMYFYLQEAPLNVKVELQRSGIKYMITYTVNKLSTLSAYIENSQGTKVASLMDEQLVTPGTYTIDKNLDLSAGLYSIVFTGKAPGGKVMKFKKSFTVEKMSGFDSELLGKITGIVTTVLALLYILSINNK